LYTSLGYGAGGTLGTLASGGLWESVGGAVTFSLAAGVAACAWAVLRFSPAAPARGSDD